MTEPLLDVSPSIDKRLYDIVWEDISAFNRSRGRRKALNPIFVKHSEIKAPYQKFGMILELVNEHQDASGCFQRVARMIAPTLLRRKPRPKRVYLDIYENCNCLDIYENWDIPTKFRIRLVILKERRIK